MSKIQSVLKDKAFIVSLKTRMLPKTKQDKSANQDYANSIGISSDDTRVGKVLFSGDLYKAVAKAKNKATNEHRKWTVDYDKGQRIIAVAHYTDYIAAMNTIQNEFELAVIEFVDSYDSIIESNKARLGGLFKASDYPQPWEIKDAFEMTIMHRDVPDAGSFVAKLADKEVERIRQEIETTAQEKAVQAHDEVCTRLLEQLKHFNAAMNEVDDNGKLKIFKNTLVENLEHAVTLADGLNLVGDSKLDRTIKNIRQHLLDVPADELRTNKDKRKEIGDKSTEILDNMVGYM